MQRSYKPGDWLVTSDLSGRVCYRSECRLMWNGLLVHHSEYEDRHPMDTMKVYAEQNRVMDARPDNVDLELNHQADIP